jgi:hypothetical protein
MPIGVQRKERFLLFHFLVLRIKTGPSVINGLSLATIDDVAVHDELKLIGEVLSAPVTPKGGFNLGFHS